MIKKLLENYVQDSEYWNSEGDALNCKNMKIAYRRLPAQFVHQYVENHGFHDWQINKMAMNYSAKGRVDVEVELQVNDQKTVIIFGDCYAINLQDCMEILWDRRFSRPELKLMIFQIETRSKINAGIATDDGSILTFSMKGAKIAIHTSIKG